jgi:PII-like signaling protein
MQGTCLRFYVHENHRHHGILLYEWLLKHAKETGIRGGSVFRAVAGFGREGILHEDHFFELAGDLPMVVEFLVDDQEAERLLQALREEGLLLFYVRQPVEFGVLKA